MKAMRRIPDRKTLLNWLAFPLLLLVLPGCGSPDGGGTSVSGSIYYGVGFYDPWYYGGYYYDDPDVIVTPPPTRPTPPPRVEHHTATPPISSAPRPMPSIPSTPRPSFRR